MTHRPVVGVLLAGGRGTRFMREAPGENKLFASLPDGRSVIEASVAAYLDSVDELVVVTGTGDVRLQGHLRRNAWRVIATPLADLGMGHTLAAGVAEARYRFPTLTGVIIGLADMPWLRASTVRAVAAALRAGADHAIVRPKYGETPGHPVALGAAYLDTLITLTGDTGAIALLRREATRIEWITTDDYGCVADVDRPSDIS